MARQKQSEQKGGNSVSIWLDALLEKAVLKLSKREKRSRSQMAAILIEEGIKARNNVDINKSQAR